MHLEHCVFCQACCRSRKEHTGKSERKHKHPKVRRGVLHSGACYFGLMFLRLYFGFMWVCSGWEYGDIRSMPLEQRGSCLSEVAV